MIKNNKKLSIILSFVCLVVLKSNAQEFKLASLNYANYSKSTIKNDSGNQEVSFQEFGVFVNFPKKFKNNKTILINGLGYGFVDVTLDNSSMFFNEANEKLQAFYYQLTVLHQWNEKWNLVVNLNPTLASDFEKELSSDDFIFQGAVSAIRKMSPNFKLGGGVAYSARFGSPRLVPLVALQYRYKKHKINALLPINAIYTYNVLPNNKFELGLKYNLNGGNFNVHSANNNVDKINYSRANFGVLANYNLTKSLHLETFGGFSAARQYSIVDTNGNTTDFDSEAAPFFSVGLVLKP